MSAPLRLMAEDAADLDVISAAAQDALTCMGDCVFDKKARRFSTIVNRFRWEEAGRRGPYERVRAALSFESVLSVRTRRLRQDAPDALASILSLNFVPANDPPGGIVRMVLAGGGEIALDVECLDALLMDMEQAWPTPRRPDHEQV